MIRKVPVGLALIAWAWASLVHAQGDSGHVRDHAGLFSAEAVRRANDALEAVRREQGWQVVIETIKTLGGRDVKERAVADAEAAQVRGLFVLIARGEHKVWVQPSHSAERAFPKGKVDAITRAFVAAFKQADYDRGLDDAVRVIRGETASKPGPAPAPAAEVAARSGPVAPASPTKPAPAPEAVTPAKGSEAKSARPALPAVLSGDPNRNLIYLVGGGALGLVLLFWLLSRAFRGPQAPAAALGPAPDRADWQGPSAGVPPRAAPGPAAAPPGYAPAVPPGYPPGYAPGPRPAAPGYGPGGYGPGYAPPAPVGGYPPPPPQGGGGGGFLGSVAGGIGGAVVGNILYDQFGRPHHEGQAAPPAGSAPPAGHGADVGAAPPTHDGGWGPAEPPPASESYDPGAGAGGDWGGAAPPPDQAGDWGGGGESVAREDGGDWGGSGATAEDAGGAWGGQDQGGDWGGDAGGGAGADEVAESGGGGDWGGEAENPGGGGDWGGDSGGESTGDTGGGGDW